jgi:2-C-methyl-D-erythritol 4-phosphate cytidylyltransferase
VQQNPRTFAVITAGGQGTRMGTALPKQFLELNGKPVLYHTIRAFMTAIPDIEIILVLPPHQISYAQMVLQAFEDRIDLTIVAGGETRYHSVQQGLKGLPEDSIIMVQDGVRPLASIDLIRRCYDQALALGSAIPAIPATDSMRMVEGEESYPLDRSRVRIVQTPQTFRGNVLLPAFQQAYSEAFTDEASVVEAAGGTVFLVTGEQRNIKITTPEDMAIAEALMKM